MSVHQIEPILPNLGCHLMDYYDFSYNLSGHILPIMCGSISWFTIPTTGIPWVIAKKTVNSTGAGKK